MCFGGCIVFGTVSFPSISILFTCSWLWRWSKKSMSSLSLLSLCVLLVFWHFIPQLFFHWFWVIFTCLFILMIVHPVLVTLICSCFPCGPLFHGPLQFNVSMVPCPLAVLLQWMLWVEKRFLGVYISLLLWGCLSISTVWLISSLSHTMGWMVAACLLTPCWKGLWLGLVTWDWLVLILSVIKIYICQHYFHGIFHGSFFFKFYSLFCLFISLMIIRWWYWMVYSKLLAEFFGFPETNFVPKSDTILLYRP